MPYQAILICSAILLTPGTTCLSMREIALFSANFLAVGNMLTPRSRLLLRLVALGFLGFGSANPSTSVNDYGDVHFTSLLRLSPTFLSSPISKRRRTRSEFREHLGTWAKQAFHCLAL